MKDIFYIIKEVIIWLYSYYKWYLSDKKRITNIFLYMIGLMMLCTNDSIRAIRANTLFILTIVIITFMISLSEDEKYWSEIKKNKTRIDEKIGLFKRFDVVKLYQGLTKYGFIRKDENIENFKAVFDGGGMEIIRPVRWLRNKQLLRELITSEKIKNVKTSQIEQEINKYFIDANGIPMKLAKNKIVPSIDSDNIKKILATI